MKLYKLFIVSVATALFLGGCASKTSTSQSSSLDNFTIQQSSKPLYVPEPNPYHAAETRVSDLIHTKLEVSFDWKKQYLYGKATLSLKPYFYSQDEVVLDAKGFDIEYINLVNDQGAKKLSYTYDSLQIVIQLDRTYTRKDTYVLEIKYTAKPEELAEGGSAAITSDKGLYFINPTGEDKEKPQQIWTQGETEASSCWFPTIDSPNEKTTQEIYITVQSKFKTISNGALIYSKENEDGTRTDYWKQEKPHSPYLFMMTVGDFAEIKDEWRGKEVHYFVEKKYEPYARGVFGITPELLSFFSDKLGYEYPWDKYYQVAVRDYVSGAMENTSAAIFLEQIQLTDREQLDKNWDYIIAHELFHHWFGDLVTCESWSNLALNESFANYSEYLWFEYKYGRDRADFHGMNEEEEYLDESNTKQVPIIRYHYHHREDMFDRHSYNKGGRVLHMLRKYVGDDAFFASLKKYLHDNQFTAAEIHHLRLAFEEVTGEDLNWFFNQWFLSPGHPDLKVEHYFLNDSVYLNVTQLQDTLYSPVFKIPLDVAIWVDGKKQIFPVVIDKTIQQFSFPINKKPDLVLFDDEQQLLGVIRHKKSQQELIFQYYNAERYMARQQALSMLLPEQEDPTLLYNPLLDSMIVRKVFVDALNDPFYDLKEYAIAVLAGYSSEGSNEINVKVKKLAMEDEKSSVRAAAIDFLAVGSVEGEEDLSLYKKMLADSSYDVVASALSAYIHTDAEDKASVIAEYRKEDKSSIVTSVAEYYLDVKDSTQIDWFIEKFKAASPRDKISFSDYLASYVSDQDSVATHGVIDYAEELALNHDHLYARFSGYKILWSLDQIEGVTERRQKIIENETNKMLVNAYERWESKIIRIGK